MFNTCTGFSNLQKHVFEVRRKILVINISLVVQVVPEGGSGE